MTTYHLTDTEQMTTLAIALIVAAVIIAGIWALAVDCLDRWSIEDAEADIDDFAYDLILDRPQHLTDVRDAMRAARSER